jgi:hypothetical protein
MHRMGGEPNSRADIAAWRTLLERDLDLLRALKRHPTDPAI